MYDELSDGSELKSHPTNKQKKSQHVVHFFYPYGVMSQILLVGADSDI